MIRNSFYKMSVVFVVVAIVMAGCSGAGQSSVISPTSEAVISPSAPPPLPTATFTLTPTLTPLPTATATATPPPTATYVPLAELDLSKVVLQTSDLPVGFTLWQKFQGDPKKMQAAFAFLGKYNKAGEPLDNAILDASVAMNNLSTGNYYVYYGVNAPLQLLTCGVLVYSDEQSAEKVYQALTTGINGEALDFPVIGSESSGYTYITPFSVGKTMGITGLWISGMVKMGIPPSLLPKTIYGNRLVWRYHEAVLHLIILSTEKIPQDKTTALAGLMQTRIEGKQ